MSNNIKQTSLMVSLLPSAVLYIAAVVLVFLSREDFAGTVQYWELFLPVVALISLISGWGQAYAFNHSRFVYLLKQIIQWGALFGLLWLLKEHGVRDAMSAQNYNLVQLYLLALTALVVGLYIDSRMLMFGLFMACCTYLLANPAHSAILAPIGDAIGIADAQNKPMTMIFIAAAIGFVVNLLTIISVRGATLAKKSRS